MQAQQDDNLNKSITVVLLARQSIPKASCDLWPSLEAPCWAAMPLTQQLVAFIQSSQEALCQNQWSETRFLHPITFGTAPRQTPNDTEENSLDCSHFKPTRFIPTLTEIVILSESLLATAADQQTGVTIETSAITTSGLLDLFDEAQNESIIYTGDNQSRLAELYESGTPCSEPKLKP